jgi:hypothetical protein
VNQGRNEEELPASRQSTRPVKLICTWAETGQYQPCPWERVCCPSKQVCGQGTTIYLFYGRFSYRNTRISRVLGSAKISCQGDSNLNFHCSSESQKAYVGSIWGSAAISCQASLACHKGGGGSNLDLNSVEQKAYRESAKLASREELGQNWLPGGQTLTSITTTAFIGPPCSNAMDSQAPWGHYRGHDSQWLVSSQPSRWASPDSPLPIAYSRYCGGLDGW